MNVLARRTPYVFCRSERHSGSGDSSGHTARGVIHAIRAGLRSVFGTPTLAHRTILVQGVGSVGAYVARLAAAEGARLVISDVEAEHARQFAATVDAEVVAARRAITTECDVYAPCALGGTLSSATIPQLRCRIVAGAANNQLATRADADRLRTAGILYAPDFVANAGGVLHAVGTERLGWTRDEAEAALAKIGDTLAHVFERAEREGVSTEDAARAIASERLTVGAARRSI